MLGVWWFGEGQERKIVQSAASLRLLLRLTMHEEGGGGVRDASA